MLATWVIIAVGVVLLIAVLLRLTMLVRRMNAVRAVVVAELQTQSNAVLARATALRSRSEPAN